MHGFDPGPFFDSLDCDFKKYPKVVCISSNRDFTEMDLV